jgi:4-amino-4-deoxy-L-arabinose transferase-like glycosyltransferase
MGRWLVLRLNKGLKRKEVEKNIKRTSFKVHSNLRTWMILAFFLILGIIRVVLVRAVIFEPWRGILVDSEQYLTLANQVLHDGTYRSPANPDLDLFRTPGYPGFLIVILGLTGGSLQTVVITQLCLVLVTAFLLFNLGRSIGNEKIGYLAGALLLVSPNALFWSVTIMTETLFTLGLTLAFVWTVKAIKDRFPVWGVGLLLGILTLVRPIGIFLVLLWTIWFLLFNLKHLGFLTSMKIAAGLFLASAIVLIPWYGRNYVQHGRFTLSNVNRVTLYSYHLALTLVEEQGLPLEEAKAEITDMGGATSAAPKIILKYPFTFARVQLKGIARTMLGTESETWLWLVSKDDRAYLGNGLLEPLLHLEFSQFSETFMSAITNGKLSALLFSFWGLGFTAVLLTLSALGTIRAFSVSDTTIRAILLLGVLIVIYLVISPGAAGEARFRVPVEPFLALFASLVFLKKSAKEVEEDEDK